MNRIAATLILGVSLLAGCHRDRSDDIIYAPGEAWYVRYRNGHPLAASSSDPFILSKEVDLETMINDHRVAIGLPALLSESSMADLARAHSIHMAIGDFESSINPEGDDPGDRADHVGIPWSRFAENISYDWSEATDAFDEMLGNPGMHDSIDDPGYTSMGAGYEHDSGSFYDDYWTVDFRTP